MYLSGNHFEIHGVNRKLKMNSDKIAYRNCNWLTAVMHYS